MMVWETVDPEARLTDGDDVDPPSEATCAEAQDAVNFVVFEPAWLPDDCDVAEVTYRPEQPPGRPDGVSAADVGQTPHSDGNPSSVRVVVDGDGRSVRLKQFLYDWAPPSASVAPLWRTDDPTPFDCGDSVGWLGTDYKDNRGACAQRERTQLELSVTEGSFDDDELTALLDGLTPADPAGAGQVRRVPFHRLNYWVRYRCRPPAVPNGLWDHAPARPYDESQEVARTALVDGPSGPTLVPAGDRFVFDSAVVFPDEAATECVFRNRANGTDHLWLTAAARGSPLAPTLPPEPSDQSAETRREVVLRGTTVHYAALTEETGAWEAVWADDGVHYGVWAGASRHLDGESFLALVDSLERA